MKRLVILGGGESGIGSAVLGVKQGYEVFLSDSGLLSQKVKEELNDLEVRFEEYGHDMNSILQADLVMKSPGIPDHIDWTELAVSGEMFTGQTLVIPCYPKFKDNITEKTTESIEKAEIEMIEQGQPEQAIEIGMKVSEAIYSPMGMFLLGILATTFMGLIISLIAAAFLKNDPDSFEKSTLPKSEVEFKITL